VCLWPGSWLAFSGPVSGGFRVVWGGLRALRAPRGLGPGGPIPCAWGLSAGFWPLPLGLVFPVFGGFSVVFRVLSGASGPRTPPRGPKPAYHAPWAFRALGSLFSGVFGLFLGGFFACFPVLGPPAPKPLRTPCRATGPLPVLAPSCLVFGRFFGPFWGRFLALRARDLGLWSLFSPGALWAPIWGPKRGPFRLFLAVFGPPPLPVFPLFGFTARSGWALFSALFRALF